MRCSNCQNEVPDGSAFCPICLSPISQAAQPAAQSAEDVPAPCPNCGYPPANPNSTICPLCHSPLPARQQQMPQGPTSEATWAPQPQQQQYAWDDGGMMDIFGEAPEAPQPSVGTHQGASVPPQPEQPPVGTHQGASVPEQPEQSTEEGEAPAEPGFALSPMVAPFMPASTQGIAFQGRQVVISGQNLPSPLVDPECQAVVSRDAEGNWTLADGSQNKSTYMLVSRPMALRDGDVIILGGNLYVFHPNEQL